VPSRWLIGLNERKLAPRTNSRSVAIQEASSAAAPRFGKYLASFHPLSIGMPFSNGGLRDPIPMGHTRAGLKRYGQSPTSLPPKSEREMSRLQHSRFLLCERARQQGVLRRPRTTLAEAPLHRYSARLRSEEPAADSPHPGNDAGVDLRRERRGPFKGRRRMDDARRAHGRKDRRRKLGYGGVSGFPRRGNGDVHLSHRSPLSKRATSSI
jgi:hypothetical protein